MAEVTSKDKILIIGCGPMPYTPIGYAEETNAKVISIDKNPKVVKTIEAYLMKNPVDGKFIIRYGDIFDISLDDFDVIVIGIVVWPIDKIIYHIMQHINERTKVICRDLKGDVNYIISNSYLKDICKIETYVNHPSGPKYKSLLIKRIN
jgi:precorrin-6B methylase 2